MIIKDYEFLDIVEDILENKQFKRLKEMGHHGCNRFDHSLKVSYYSYKVSKFLGLDYYETARAALIHDFFFTKNDRNAKEFILSNFTHPKEAVNNSMKYFSISEKEKNIILSHMFPLVLYLPKYSESWIVNMVDKLVATQEWSYTFSYKLRNATTLIGLFIINIFK
ncbi:MAG: phosphohydrolase [Mollicutes bacterium]|jgi:uncharacterized protein|nr:phosphohydrolase [Mollicutes bacterium]